MVTLLNTKSSHQVDVITYRDATKIVKMFCYFRFGFTEGGAQRAGTPRKKVIKDIVV